MKFEVEETSHSNFEMLLALAHQALGIGYSKTCHELAKLALQIPQGKGSVHLDARAHVCLTGRDRMDPPSGEQRPLAQQFPSQINTSFGQFSSMTIFDTHREGKLHAT